MLGGLFRFLELCVCFLSSGVLDYFFGLGIGFFVFIALDDGGWL